VTAEKMADALAGKRFVIGDDGAKGHGRCHGSESVMQVPPRGAAAIVRCCASP
jgi:hypothetical protein